MSVLPNPFSSAAIVERPAETLPAEVPGKGHSSAGSCSIDDDISHIGEIFRGARKLQSVPDIFEFDDAAITTSDRLLYDVLKAMVDPRLPGLRKIPDEQALFDAIEPPPLFLQAVGY